MAKDDREILSAVREGGRTYKPGMEDELAAVLKPAQIKRLTEQGALAGAWGAKAAEPEKGRK